MINLDECKSTRTDWVTFHVNGNNVTYLIALELNTFQKKFSKNHIQKK